MEQYAAWVCLLVGYLLSRAAEWRVHQRNYAFVKFAGGEELISAEMRRFYAVSFAMPIFALGEGLFGPFAVAPSLKVFLLLALGTSLAIRFFAISALGRLWTQRCICVPGLPICRKGPYRFLRHPEYASRLIDGVALALIFNAPVSAALFAVYFSLAMSKIVSVENRQLAEVGFDLAAELDAAAP